MSKIQRAKYQKDEQCYQEALRKLFDKANTDHINKDLIGRALMAIIQQAQNAGIDAESALRGTINTLLSQTIQQDL